MFDINELISKDQLNESLSGKKQTNGFSDERFWLIPEGESLIRLLPRLENKVPYVVSFAHRYSLDGQNIVVDCLRTFGKNCPICTKSWEMKESGVKNLVDLSVKIYARRRYIYNAYIVNDPMNQKNNGSIKLVSIPAKMHGYSKKLPNGQFTFIPGVVTTALAGEFGNDIYNPENGFDLKIIRRGKGLTSDYSASTFKITKSKVCDFSKISDKLYNIDKVFAEKEKTPEELKKVFYFLGFDNSSVIYESGDAHLSSGNQSVEANTKEECTERNNCSKNEESKKLEVKKQKTEEIQKTEEKQKETSDYDEEIDDILADIE